MKLSRIEIPALQNWSCHGCTDCCRDKFVVTISAGEKKRIEDQRWTAADGVEPSAIFVARQEGYLLGHRSDGACVFLDTTGRCRIHSKFGEAAKPLACRLYPLVVMPAGNKLVVGLRFSCPSAAANRGKPMPEQAGEIRKLSGLALPERYREVLPPPVLATPGLEWPDYLRFVKWLDVALALADVPIALKILRALQFLGSVEKGCLDKIGGESADEILEALVRRAGEKNPALSEKPSAPSRFGRVFFRTMVMEYARTVSVDDMLSPGQYRWNILRAIFRFLPASGRTPALSNGLRSVKFSAVEKSFGPLPQEMEASLTRYFRMKVQSLQFCGLAFHGASLIEGFRSLALLYPVIVWLSRWRALSEGRTSLSNDDLLRAISLVDSHHGYSPYQRWRVKLLAQRNDITRLCGWYAR